MGDKEKVLESREKEALFEEIEKKVRSGKTLISIFENHTSDEGVQIETITNKKNKKVNRAIALISSSASDVMELSYFEDPKLNLLTLTVFGSENDCLKGNDPEIRVIITAFKRGDEPDVEIADYRGKKKNFNLKNRHDDLLLDILTEAYQSLKIGIDKK